MPDQRFRDFTPAQLVKTLEEKYDDLEKAMLNEFFDHIHNHNGYTWVHWNMRDINYGFEAISHRARVLGIEPQEVPEDNRFDFARCLIEIYGKAYAGHPRLQSLMKLNLISNMDALSGEDEATAFAQKQYVKLHMSTLRKVDVMSSLFTLASNKTLKTRMPWKQGWAVALAAALVWLQSHWVATVIGISVTIFGIVGTIIGLSK